MLKQLAKLEHRLILAALRLFLTRLEQIGPLALENWYDCQPQGQNDNRV